MASPDAVRTNASWWLDEALASETDAAPCPPLEADARADICIVGGGYTGLWTALRLKELEPSLDILLIEAKYCGYGASGRNGGVLLDWATKFAILIQHCGTQEAVRLHRLARANVAEIEAFCGENRIDCELRRDGWLWTSNNAAQDDVWRPTLGLLDKAGEHPFVELNAAEAQERAGSPLVRGAVFEPGVGTLQPAKLARGLRKVALAKGVRIHEGTRMTRLERGKPPRVHTSHGIVTAKRVILGLNAWAAEMPRFRRTILPLASDQLMTARIPELLAKIGLRDGMFFSDSRLLVFGGRTTKDGRLNFSKGGGDFVFRGQVGALWDEPARREREVTDLLHRVYPALKGVKLEGSWRGPVTRTPTGLPFFGAFEDCPDILYGHGYCGNGVGPSRIGGRILASLALERKDEWSSIPLAQGQPDKRFPPEPFRYVGAYIVRSAVVRKEAAEDAGRKPNPVDTLLAGFAPSSLVPVNTE